MRNSILFTLACLTLVLSGCFNRSTKTWDLANQVDPNDLDGDGIENACDVDYVDGPLIDSDLNGEIDACQPDTDGDGIIDAVDLNPLTPLNGGPDLNNCPRRVIRALWSDFDRLEGNVNMDLIAKALLSYFPNEDMTGHISRDRHDEGDAEDRLKRARLSTAGELREKAVIFNRDGDCFSYAENVGAAMLLSQNPDSLWMLDQWLSATGNRNIDYHSDFDGDGIDNRDDPSVDLLGWADLATATSGKSGSWLNKHRVLYYLQVAIIQELVSRGVTVNLNTSL